jgi:transcription elongation GreA/GreB family factor
MDKKKLVDQVRKALEEELATLTTAANAAREAATHEENKPEDEYDTRSVEAAYLASAQSKRVEEIRKQLTVFRFLPVRDYGPNDAVCPAALVELDHKGTRAFYFIVPQGGGLVTEVDGKPVQIITPMSPIGDALMGRHVGDVIEVEMRNGTREYKVISIR